MLALRIKRKYTNISKIAKTLAVSRGKVYISFLSYHYHHNTSTRKNDICGNLCRRHRFISVIYNLIELIQLTI